MTRFNRFSSMFLISVGVLSFSAVPSSVSCQTVGSASSALTIPDATPVHLILMDDLQSGKMRVGDVVHFEVREDVLISRQVVIKHGAAATGRMVRVSKTGLAGKSGRLMFHLEQVNSAAGTAVALRGQAGAEGGKGGALTAISAAWFGPEARLPAGTMLNAYVDGKQSVEPPLSIPADGPSR